MTAVTIHSDFRAQEEESYHYFHQNGEPPWIEEPGGLQSMGSQRVRHDWAAKHSTQHTSSSLLFSYLWFDCWWGCCNTVHCSVSCSLLFEGSGWSVVPKVRGNQKPRTSLTLSLTLDLGRLGLQPSLSKRWMCESELMQCFCHQSHLRCLLHNVDSRPVL